jgi:phosphoadenosine phosphosulfate reductase
MADDYLQFGYAGDGTAHDVLRWALGRYHPRIAVACSFQHAVVVHLAVRIQPDVRVFSVDTGRLPEETYECARDFERALGIRIEWVFPRHEAVEKLLREGGPYSFRESPEARRHCCGIRKVEPTLRALTGLDAWISGIRREQGVTRRACGMIEQDQAHGGILKINPLADWTSEEVREYAKKHRLPHNRLLDRGYTSIGCACCTRPVQPGEDPRAGRWWWESPEHKECGLHVSNWSI